MFNFFSRKWRYRRFLNYGVIPYGSIRAIVTNMSNIVIDVRDENEYNIMHIKNSVNIPVNRLIENENVYRNKEKIIVYCSTGIRTKEAIQTLNNIGYNNVYIWKYGTLSNFPFRDLVNF